MRLDALRARTPLLAPAVVAATGIVPCVIALRAQTFAIFGRDQGIFQYVAWALANGERAYRDIHEINGPLPHAWHMVMQALGGTDEHVFRSIDTAMLVVVYVLAAAGLPRWIGLQLGSSKRSARLGTVAWSLAGLVVLGAQYTRYDWWHSAQREGLYSALVLSSLALQALAHATFDVRRGTIAIFVASALSALTWFGKPPCAIFAVLQAGVFVLDRKNIAVPARRALAAAFAAAVLVASGMLGFVARFGDLRLLLDLASTVPRLHHTIWNETLLGSYHAYNNAPRLDWAMVSFAAFLAAYALVRLPRRALLATVLPVGGFAVFVGQGKAFPYHLHMLTLGTGVLQLATLGALVKYVHDARIPDDRPARHTRVGALAVATLVVALGLGAKSAEDAWKSPAVRHGWADVGATASMRTSHAYFARFPWGDFSAEDLRDAAAYIQERTTPDERVQTYGFDPYLLFLARRRSASPVIYSFELNVDAALAGGPGAHPSPELRSWLLAYRDDAERLVFESVEASPPAAFTLHDDAPFTHPENAEKDFAEHCPTLYAWMKARYVFAAAFGTVRVWLRRDVATRVAAVR